MKTAILYARVARADQCTDHNNPLQKQMDELINFCKQNNIQVELCYKEIASGATFDRPMFKQLLLQIEQGNVKADMILFTKWDRFSRNLSAALEMIKVLRTLGIKAKSIDDFDSSDLDILLTHVLKSKK